MFRRERARRMPLPAGAPRRGKKAILAVIGVAAALAVAGAVVVVVFRPSPKDKARARELMKVSDDTVQSTKPKGDKISRSVNVILPDIAYLSKAQYDVTAGNVRDLAREAREDLEKARRGYDTILELRGVDGYKEYARLKLNLIDVDVQQLQVVDSYLDYLGRELAQREAGTALNSQAIANATGVSNQKLSELGDRMDELSAQAEQIRKEKEL